MLKLIKYEFIKKSKLFLILIVTAILINIGLGLTYGENGIIAFLILSPMVLGIIYLYELIKSYSDDLNKKTGYMLFMTPNSGYKIIGSKLITIILIGFMFAISYVIFAFINISFLAYKIVGNFSLITEGIYQLIDAFNVLIRGTIGINLGDLMLIFILGIVTSIVFILTVYSAITIRRSIFSNNKFGGLLSFVIFIILNVVISKIGELVGNLFNFEYIMQTINENVTVTYPSTAMFELFSVTIVLNIIIGIALMLGSGYLIEKKINL